MFENSVTIWAAMALNSARKSGLTVPVVTFKRIRWLLDNGQDLTGATSSNNQFIGGHFAYTGTGLDSSKWRRSRSTYMASAAALMRVFLGDSRYHPGVVGPSNLAIVSRFGNGSIESYKEKKFLRHPT